MKHYKNLLTGVVGLAISMNLTAQTVTTHPFVARGATTAFVRSTIADIEPSDIKERGVCWSSEHSAPTIADQRTTQTIKQGKTTEGGVMHRINGLEAATVYHLRAYVELNNSIVHYGQSVKVITIPRGDIKWTYNNNNGSDEVKERMTAAIIDAVNYLNEYTSIQGFHTTVNYTPGVPTADCSYGGWIRMGKNPSYQRTGTILHELQHGIGVGQHWVWCNNPHLRANTSRGIWLGDRVTELLRFWDNDESSVLQGDRMHMWPYGINGAHEDTGKELLYIGSSLIMQALGEDGLPPTGGFCTPAYTFNQEDTIKYYIKSETSSDEGNPSYLKENSLKQLTTQKVATIEPAENDSCAWYITFNPQTCYYQLRNAATGHYLAFLKDKGFMLSDKKEAANSENLQLMRSRIDSNGLRGYWIIYPERRMNPACLNMDEAGNLGTAPFNMSNDATRQRWLIVTAN